MLNARQLEIFVGVFEEGSLSKAARRLNATQSGLSMQIQNLEARTGLRLFDRSPRGVTPTAAARRLYKRALAVLRSLDETSTEIRALAKGVSGVVKVGLMPTFTRGVLAPALGEFISEHPHVEISIKEAYSAALVDEVLAGAIDFAIVPRELFPSGVRTRWLGRDQEMLVRRAGSDGPGHMQPVRLADLGVLDLVLPARGNARRDAFDSYAQLHGVALGRVITMDAMIATLEFVAASDFATILPQTICFNDRDGALRSVHPIVGPGFQVDYAVVAPARAALSAASALLLKRIESHYHASQAVWAKLGVDISAPDGRHEQVSLQGAGLLP